MIKLWIMLIMVVGKDGSAPVDRLNIPNKPEYNNEQSCRENAEIIAADLQLKIGKMNGTVYWDCVSLDLEDVEKALPPRV